MENKLDNKNALDTNPEDAYTWHPTEEGIQAFENIKSLGRREIAEGRGDSAISRFIKLLIEEVEKASGV